MGFINGLTANRTTYYRTAGGIGGSIKDAENGIVVSPGKGAIMKGIFYVLKQGEEYNIVIGQNGTEPRSPRANPWNGGAGAGGGTFMWQKIASKPLIVAGGGEDKVCLATKC